MDANDILQAVAVLKRGGMVAFPTETVYGLGVDADNPEALRALYALKGRPSAHPVIVHIETVGQLSQWAREIPATAYDLAAQFWPGPLTLILKRAARVNDFVTGSQDTVGVRVPAHPVARALLAAFGQGVAAPSANRFGHVSATTASHVREEFGAAIDTVLEGGACEIGIESTIVDVSGAQAVLLRPGRISIQELTRALGVAPGKRERASPRVSGMLATHYAPRTPLKLVSQTLLKAEVLRLLSENQRIGVLAFAPSPPSHSALIWISAPQAATAYERELYANLRRLDASGCDILLIETLPADVSWSAAVDRLTRAAGQGSY